MEKVYKEWITMFSDDSLFDEMTEGMRNEELSKTGKSPEQRAAEGLLLLRNQTNNEANDVLMPVDEPKLPDLVLEMDAEITSTNTRNEEQSIRKETDNTHTRQTNDAGKTTNTKQKEKNKDLQNTTKTDSTKSPTKGVFQMRTIGLWKTQVTYPPHCKKDRMLNVQ